MRLKDPPKKFIVAESIRRPCSTCGKPLMLTRIEPDNPGYDLRVYYCAHCEVNETDRIGDCNSLMSSLRGIRFVVGPTPRVAQDPI